MSGMKFVFQQIADLADQELNDEGALRDQLLLLHSQLEDGDIDEDDFAEREAELLARMREIKQRKLDAAQATPADADGGAQRRFIVETQFDE
jgi:hypothetical protein